MFHIHKQIQILKLEKKPNLNNSQKTFFLVLTMFKKKSQNVQSIIFNHQIFNH